MQIKITVPNQDSVNSLVRIINGLWNMSNAGISREIRTSLSDNGNIGYWDGDGNHKINNVEIITPRKFTQGWRVFLCEGCYASWKEACRDYQSPSGSECPLCGKSCEVKSCHEDLTLPVDKNGNLHPMPTYSVWIAHSQTRLDLKNEMIELGAKLGELQPKIDSGQCKGSDIQARDEMLRRYLNIEELLRGN